MAIKPDLPKNIEPTEDPEALKHGYRAMLAGMEYALNRILADVNQVRIALGLRELEIKRSDAGLNVKPSNSGITEQGRQK